MLPLIRPTASKSPFQRTKLMRQLRLPEVKVMTEEEKAEAVVVAVDSVAEEERVVTDLLVKVETADLSQSVVTDPLVKVVTDHPEKVATVDPLVKVAIADPLVRAVNVDHLRILNADL